MRRAAESSRTPTLPFSDADAAVIEDPVPVPADSAESTPTQVDAAPAAAETTQVPVEAALPQADAAPAQPDAASAAVDEAQPSDLSALGVDDLGSVEEGAPERVVEWAGPSRPATALSWVETADVAESSRPADLNAITMDGPVTDLLADAKLRPVVLRSRWLVPVGTIATCAIAYSASMLMWPLHEVPPVVQPVEFATVAPEPAEIVWPSVGSAGLSMAGVSSAASATQAVPIASVTKVVSSLMVLDRMPLQLGEQGPEFAFDYGDTLEYWDYRIANQSALDVPVDGMLTEYQLLQGTLMGSANNYIDRLARELWGSDQQFAQAAKTWLAERGLGDITIVTPSGFDEGNVATPEALLRLGERAMQNPVFAEIVGTVSAEIPGAGLVENTNGMLADPGVVGIKTGTLVGWNLLTAKDVTVGETTVHLYASVLNQNDDAERLAVTRSLFDQAEAALATISPAVPAGTVVGEISTPWGTSVDIVSDEDATVVLWNGTAASAAVEFDLSNQREEGEDIGTVTVTGPVDQASVDASLAEEIAGPSPWWRLTHPLELLGLSSK